MPDEVNREPEAKPAAEKESKGGNPAGAAPAASQAPKASDTAPAPKLAPAAAPAPKPAPAAAPGHAVAPAAHGGAAKVPAFPAGEAEFPVEPPIAGPPDLGHWVLQMILWGLVVICGAFVLVGCVQTFSVILQYYRG